MMRGGVQLYTNTQQIESDPMVTYIKLVFMLNSAEREIFSANKYENANNSCHFHIY